VKAEAQQLSELLQRNTVTRPFFELVSEQPRLRREVPVDVVVERTGKERREVVRMFRELEALEAGRLVVGRRRQKTRFMWSDGIDVVATAKQFLLGTLPPAEAQKASTVSAAPMLPGASIRHRYVLRPNLELELLLPSDLTVREAERLAEFVKTLPFNQA
jgi:hypothetical protein